MHLKYVLVVQQESPHVLQIYASKIKGILREVGSCHEMFKPKMFYGKCSN